METRAYLKGTRLSPQKAALVADQIRGKSVDEAMDFLVFNKQKGSAVMKKLRWSQQLQMLRITIILILISYQLNR